MNKKAVILLVCMIALICLPTVTYADQKSEKVRVGYYENEVFQEGAGEGEIRCFLTAI